MRRDHCALFVLSEFGFLSSFEYEIKMGRSSLVDIAQIVFEKFFFDTVIRIANMANMLEF